ncbi:MAG TPA: serine/threonine-protein phosphatase [Ruminococcus sp.]|nr:serine/threonine-protein phosphatase [Ruminococcus sp.]
MIRYIAAGGTAAGLRGNTNQDSFGAKIIRSGETEIAAVIMCDGMGGYARGEVASATVVDAFQRWLLRRLPFFCETGIVPKQIFDEWLGIAELCSRKIGAYGKKNGIRIGTTAAMLLLTPEQYLIMNIGDCRVYEIGADVRQITRDQTLVQQEVDAGLLTPEEAEHDPRSHVLSECIGAAPAVHPDFYVGKPAAGSVFLLCCDGFRHKIGPAEMLEHLAPEKMTDCGQMQKQLLSLINLDLERGERDNISAAAVSGIAGESAKADGSFVVLQEFCYTNSAELAENLVLPESGQ